MIFRSKLWMIWATYFSPKSFQKVSRDYTQYVIGGIALSWASIETAIDGLNLVAYHSGGNQFTASLPRALNRKIQFLKIAFKKLPALQGYAEGGSDILARVETLSDDRHWAIHGTVMQHTGNVDLDIIVEKARRYDHYIVFERKEMSVKALLDVWEKSEHLAVELFKFGRPMRDKFLKEGADNSAGG